ncbi:hypothetical protein [Priestia megaterium]|uniref:hypothetical protein n=1 Tax=Priestia megaterium TaxID=1404 RepID=UPI002FFEEEFF
MELHKSNAEIMEERLKIMLAEIHYNQQVWKKKTSAVVLRKKLGLSRQLFNYMIKDSRRFKDLMFQNGIKYENNYHELLFYIDKTNEKDDK